MTKARVELKRAAAIEDRADRTIRVAASLCDALRAGGCEPVLVGGGAVEIYTRSAYTTHDLDFVAASTPELEQILSELGFERDGRHWIHAELSLTLEFPSSVLAPATSVSMRVRGQRLDIISVEDLVVDRLASWKHWGWDPDGAAAALLLAIHEDLDSSRLQDRARQEDVADALESLLALARRDEPLEAEELQALRNELGG